MIFYEPGTKCENEDCNNEVAESDFGNLCSGYMDCTEGERWCNCCKKCRADCHLGRLEEDEEDEENELI